MIEHAVVYDTATGAIRSVVSGPSEALILQPAQGEALLVITEDANDLTHYVDLSTGELTARAALPYTLATDTGVVQLTGLPQSCTLSVLGQEYAVTDGAASITFDAPGVYTIGLAAEPMYLATQIEVVVP